MLRSDRKQLNSVKQLFFNKKINLKEKKNRGKSEINNPSLSLMELEKEELKSKVSRRMEIINRRAELNEIETRKKIIKETGFFFFWLVYFCLLKDKQNSLNFS